MNKIILCDADDTIENLCETWVDYLNREHGTNVAVEDIVDWDISKFFPQLSRQQVFAPIFNKELWRKINPIAGCYNVLKQINEQNELYIVTATNYQTCDTKVERILKLYPFLKWPQFIITERKQLIRGDYLIDDGVHNFDGGCYSGILFDRPHNRSFNNELAGIIRVHTWDEIGNVLLK